MYAIIDIKLTSDYGITLCSKMLNKRMMNESSKTYIVKKNSHVVVPKNAVPPLPLKMRTTVGRFTTDVENLHGRLAMVGLVGCALDETVNKIPVVQQFVSETGIPSVNLLAFVTVVTSLFVLETFNPVTIQKQEPELDVFNNPGFTLETEILHGRIAMLAFAYVVLGEQLYSKLLL